MHGKADESAAKGASDAHSNARYAIQRLRDRYGATWQAPAALAKL